MRIQFLGGAEAIGASSSLVEMGGTRLLVDCGVRLQGPLQERLPHLAALEDAPPQAVLVTHAHLDHIGALPVLSQRFPALPVYATPPTLALMRIQLLDALKIMEMGSEAEGEMPLYSRAAVESLLARAVPARPYTPFEPVPGGPVATFFLSGHILGAAAVGLAGRDGRVLFTGDVATQNQRTIPGMTPPGFRPQLVVCESTYGARLHAARASEEERLVQMIGETIAGRGKVLIPAFAIGRAQEVILILIQAMLTKRLPPFPVHVDGLVRNVCQVYRDFTSYLQPRLKRRVERFGDPFFDVLENVRPVAGERRRQEILEGPPCAVVASSGMLTGGASPIYARALLHGSENLIAITGYQDEESPGRRLLEAAEGRVDAITIGGREVAVRCRVEKYALSAHADGNGLAGLIRALAPSDTLLVHGSSDARKELAELLLRERLGRVHLPREDGAYGFVLGNGSGHGGRVLASGIGSGPISLPELQRHLLVTYRERASFSSADLYRVWHGREAGEEQTASLEKELQGSPLFAPDPHKPFHYRACVPEPVDGGPLPPNEVLARLEQAIPAEAGLLRKSYQPGLPHVDLHFAFPHSAVPRWQSALEAALAGSGWTYSVSPLTNPAALNRLIIDRVPDSSVLARSASFRNEERTATLWLSRELAAGETPAWDAAAAAIEEESGYRVLRRVKLAAPAARRERDDSGRMEVNLAYERIARSFDERPHRPSRIGLHPGRGDEGAVIRLSFISPEVGERYRDVLEALEKETGWLLRLAPSADQNAICEEARKLLSPLGRIRRGPRFLPAERAVEVLLEGSEAGGEDIRALFRDRTGYDLKLSWKPGGRRDRRPAASEGASPDVDFDLPDAGRAE